MKIKKKKKKKLKEISRILNLSERELKEYEHAIDITKTCRCIVKWRYHDITTRSTMLVSSMSSDTPQATHGKCISNYLKISFFYFSRLC
jgi:hypothetical protein